jgi:hypothetical protein
MKESQLVNAVIGRLWYERNWLRVWRANAGKVRLTTKDGKVKYYQGNVAGCPDIIGYMAPAGKFIGIECKVGKNNQTDYQKDFQEDSGRKGALYAIVRSPEELEALINRIKSVDEVLQ